VDTLGVHRAVQGIALVSRPQRCGGVLGALVAGVTLAWWGASDGFLVLMATCYSTGACVLYALRRQGLPPRPGREPIRAKSADLSTRLTVQSGRAHAHVFYRCGRAVGVFASIAAPHSRQGGAFRSELAV